jgi:GntR family transcriptional regulator/MocR family aminotransferase
LKTITADLLLQRLDPQPADGHAGTLADRVFSGLREAILAGSLAPDSRLPATRDLALELGVSRNTVVHAYERLKTEGYVRAVTGSGTFVTPVLPDALLFAEPASRPGRARRRAPGLSRRGRALLAGALASPVQWGAFVPGVPDVTEFPHRTFARIAERVRRGADPSLFTYSRGGGHAPLQAALATHLKQARAVRCEPERILVTEGVHQAIDLIVRVLGDPGDVAWIEEPGYWGIRGVLRVNGIEPRPMPIDVEGLRVPAAPRGPAPRFVFVTPSHQYPLGPVMSLARRTDLLAFAARHGSWIVEDDYDSEFRFAGRPVPSLQGLVPHAPVLYVGTFSKTLYPGLRMAYLIVPDGLVDAFRAAHAELYRDGHLPMQAALAEFIDSGLYAAHIRRMRLIYANRRAALLSLVDRWLGADWRDPHDTPAGLHVVLSLPDALDDVTVAARAATAGVAVRPLSRYYAGPRPRQGLLLGFGCVPERAMPRPFQRLADCLAQACVEATRPAGPRVRRRAS